MGHGEPAEGVEHDGEAAGRERYPDLAKEHHSEHGDGQSRQLHPRRQSVERGVAGRIEAEGVHSALPAASPAGAERIRAV
ncbi:hypothetical protein GCM10022402_03480 [Salinactinospora qingdaonensis]|uniref:Uncharacterized protein n=1 Tax=Salinactinospora qingdaonensis TaxID=702744 RepID=A0ABP7EWF0_9ACTN